MCSSVSNTVYPIKHAHVLDVFCFYCGEIIVIVNVRVVLFVSLYQLKVALLTLPD